MPRTFECPKCGEDITDSYEPYDPDCGVMQSSYYCSKCDEAFVKDEGDYDDYDC